MPGSNIHTLGESVWWSLVTVTTVGYGDFYPVTIQGRVTAGKSHINRIFAKLGIRDRVQAVVLAYETGLVTPGDSPAAHHN